MALHILLEDTSIVAVNKPAGLPVIPGRNLKDPQTLQKQVEEHLHARAFVVHRLDKETSGAILFAKDAITHRALSLQFERREVTKTYLAAVQGLVESDLTVEAPVKEFGSGRMGVGPGGKPAVTALRVLQRFGGCSLLEARPGTGRRHQIRVHCYSIGHPVLGDPLYGRERPVGGASRLMLHSLQLDFQHPDGHAGTVRAETGDDWRAVISTLGPSIHPNH